MSDEKGFSFYFTKQVFLRAIDGQLTVISDEVNQVTKRMIADWLFRKYFFFQLFLLEIVRHAARDAGGVGRGARDP